MKEHRILTQVAGHHLDVIKLLPPLVITEAHVNRFLTAFESVVAACHTFPGSAWKVTKDLAAAASRAGKLAKEEALAFAE
jgi:hypothetical protein